ncbi:DivIVA domain-containing protein [Porcipelethomonas sp.]|uniref:DivIVA domain-containing protein n=1 Tax=Porcipelethomonas sp. TaxID=2981675 RepID=UPI000821F9E8|nr:DivIVA domain-containing protein [Ruminococcus sp.]OLA71070.1 MAG: cell division initiation protein [Ruminococcus sp. 37_24]SCI91429.1 Minicell-associated protein DivIVA [uncultured Ruminococcus sp.]
MISASDIRERKFEKAAFGYKQEEIDDFLAELISEFEELDAEREDLHSKIQILADKVREYRQDEDALKDALLGAQKQGHKVVAEAQEKADEIIAQAEEKAKILLDEATVQHEAAMEKNRAEIAKEKENLIEAQKQVSEFKKSLFDMYKTHLEMISAMPEIELDEEDTSQYSEQTETTEEELPQPDPFATSSFSARTIKGVYESRFTDLQFGQNNSHTGNTTTTEKEEV